MLRDGYARHTPTLSGVRLVRALSIDSALISHVSEALTNLVNASEWLEVGDSVDAITTECWRAVGLWYSDMLVGHVQSFLGALPEGYLALDGTTYDAVDYPELYAYLDAVFKDEIAEQFTLPDFSNRYVCSIGGPVGMGDMGGAQSVALSVNELPAHSHSYIPVTLDIDIKTVGAPNISAGSPGAPIQTGETGGGAAHENEPPFIALRFGIFSGRP